MKPLPCPFCGALPIILPEKPERDGGCWGEVKCVNKECCVSPCVYDGDPVADDRGSEAYIQLAIERWNIRKEKKDDSKDDPKTNA